MPHGKKHDLIKSFAEGVFGKKLTDRAGGGGKTKNGSKSLGDIRKELKGY